ncbi:MAG: polyprenyl synthetase family protein [Parachlamydiales bacterium]|nr:polyprenyl synthetase family protein [Parachlamydiales bacterium]
MRKEKQLIEKRLKNLLKNKKDIPHQILYDAANYSMDSSAKRIRPLLLLATVKSFNKRVTCAIDPACALELVHSYSLIHDDLPSMDNDDLRRGKPTLHKKYPEWVAILTGDFLLTYAFEILSDSKNLDATQKVNLIKILSNYSGGNGLIAGQIVDLISENKKIEIEMLEFMHIHKTSKLFQAAMEMGCIISKANKTITKKLSSLAEKLGIIFQLQDDILDVSSTEKVLGKKIHSDQKLNKATYVSILGLPKAKELLKKQEKEILDILNSLPIETKYLKNLIDLIFKRKK